MGCYDSIEVFMECPYCNRYQHFDCQTKDMDSCMWHFDALKDDWFDKKYDGFGSKKFRKGMPMFKKFPFDKDSPWKNQAEKIEASARLLPEWGKKLRFVNVIVDCKSTECDTWARTRDRRAYGYESGFGRMFSGKIAIIENKGKHYFISPIYDIVKNDKRLPKKPNKKEVRK